MNQNHSVTHESPKRVTLEMQVETPENVVLKYQLAGPSLRCSAYIVDLIIRSIIAGTFYVLLNCAGLIEHGADFGVGVLLLIAFLLEWFYFVFCETVFNGRTPGKKMFGLRVIQERGYTITFWSSLVRNLIRAADRLPFFYSIGFLSMLLTKHFQRLGDLAGGTVVIQERRVVLPLEPIIFERIQPLNRQELSSYIPSEQTLTLIDQFLGRRHVLDHDRGHAICAELAQELAHRLEYEDDTDQVTTYPMAFLAKVYVTFLRIQEEELDEFTPGEGRKRNRSRRRTRRTRSMR